MPCRCQRRHPGRLGTWVLWVGLGRGEGPGLGLVMPGPPAICIVGRDVALSPSGYSGCQPETQQQPRMQTDRITSDATLVPWHITWALHCHSPRTCHARTARDVGLLARGARCAGGVEAAWGRLPRGTRDANEQAGDDALTGWARGNNCGWVGSGRVLM